MIGNAISPFVIELSNGEDILEKALAFSSHYMAVVSTAGGTTNVIGTNYNYSGGFIFKRAELRWIILFNRKLSNFAINTYDGANWIGWSEK